MRKLQIVSILLMLLLLCSCSPNEKNVVCCLLPCNAPRKFHCQRTDIYSLGVTLYSIITRNDPSNPPYMVYPIRKVNPMLSRAFEYILSKYIERDPEDRYQNVQEVLSHLQNVDKLSRRLSRPNLLQRLLSLGKKEQLELVSAS